MRTPLRLAIPILALLLAGCLPDEQPHHEPVSDELAGLVRASLVATIIAIDGAPMPSDRQLDWQAELLANFARDAAPAYAALTDGSFSPAQLQNLGATLVERLAERQGPEAQPPLILTALLDRDELDRGEQILLLGSLNRLASEGQLKLSTAELRFLGRLPPVHHRPGGSRPMCASTACRSSQHGFLAAALRSR